MELAQEHIIDRTKERKISSGYLFFTFLKIGLVSFGGHMALISVIQKEMVEKDKVISTDTILNATGIASLLPGPVAVNVVAYTGYYLNKKTGALVSMAGILLPACSMMLILSFFYFRYMYTWNELNLMYYVTGTVGAIILSSGLHMFHREVQKNLKKVCFCAAAILAQFFFNSSLLTAGLIVSGGVLGILLKVEQANTTENPVPIRIRPDLKTRVIAGILALIELLFLTSVFRYFENMYAKILLVFSGISLSLFGGGYVMVPIMQSLFVGKLSWLNNQEFIDSIAFSQITPGPILVSATFTGYKLAGLTGALLATVAIFLPSAVLMITVAGIFQKNKDHPVVRNMLGGIKAIVIGLIIASGLRIAAQLGADKFLIFLAAVAFILGYRFRISPVYLILSSIIIGLIDKIYF